MILCALTFIRRSSSSCFFVYGIIIADEQALELQDAHVAQVRISFVGGGAGGVSLGSLQQPPASDWEYLSGLRAAAEATASGAASGRLARPNFV